MTPASAVLSAERAAVDAALARAADALLADVPDALAAPIRYALAGDGKRLRPILCTAAFRALRPAAADPPIHDLAAALEIIHTYSLVHDDLPCMDNDDLRRGRPTVHRAFDARMATVAGAFMIPLAFRQLASAAAAMGLPQPTQRLLAGELAAAAGAAGMVGGQWLDLDGEGGAGSVAGLERIHAAKTGALMGAALALGAIAAEADGATIAAFRRAGAALGVAFQIHDDVLDETASAAVLGKTAGKDRESGKATFPARLGLDGARVSAGAAAERARTALRSVGVADPVLDALITFAVKRDR
jgi:geranylgeranyl pyrophosphate synthase